MSNYFKIGLGVNSSQLLMDGQTMDNGNKPDHKSSPCHYVIGELKNAIDKFK